MFAHNEHLQQAPFAGAMQCAAATLLNKIVSSDVDRVGVLLYGTQQAHANPAGFAHIHLLMDLDVPSAERIKRCQALAQDPGAAQRELGSTDDVPLGNVFWTCASVFARARQAQGTRRVFLFTCEDAPNAGSPALQRAARTRGRDLAELGISLELFAIPPAGQPTFRTGLFFRDLLGRADADAAPDADADAEDTVAAEEALGRMEELLARVRRREQRKRVLQRTSLALGGDVRVAVRLYALCLEAQRGQHVWMDARTETVAQARVRWLDEATGALLPGGADRSAHRWAFDYDKHPATFTPDELDRLKACGLDAEPAGLHFLGTRPLRCLLPEHQLAHATFLYPDEAAAPGSAALLAALLHAAIELDVFLLCRLHARRATLAGPVRLVALVPQPELLDAALGAQLRAPGFHLLPLPFADDLRAPRLPPVPAPPPALVARAEALVSRLLLGQAFAPDAIDNPALLRHYAYLQALALGQDEPEPVDDASLPNRERVHKRAAALITAFIEESANANASAGAGADADAGAGAGPSAKRRKTAAAPDAPSIDLASLDADALQARTVAELKAFLTARGVSPGRVKADLIKQILALSEQ